MRRWNGSKWRCRSTKARLRRCKAPNPPSKWRSARLVETGWIAPGTLLTDKKRRLSATVRADGSLVAGDRYGSIHGLGAKLQDAPTCNGWTFWHLDHDGQSKPVDAIRQLYILATEP